MNELTLFAARKTGRLSVPVFLVSCYRIEERLECYVGKVFGSMYALVIGAALLGCFMLLNLVFYGLVTTVKALTTLESLVSKG